jgi:osmotically inducible protein OsmC
MKNHGSAVWSGGLKDGKGSISTQSGALKEYPYGFASRFEGKPGTNPEELIGAAHAGCFTMPAVSPWRCRTSWARPA